MPENTIPRVSTVGLATTPDRTRSETGVLQINRTDFAVAIDHTVSAPSMAMAVITNVAPSPPHDGFALATNPVPQPDPSPRPSPRPSRPQASRNKPQNLEEVRVARTVLLDSTNLTVRKLAEALQQLDCNTFANHGHDLAAVKERQAALLERIEKESDDPTSGVGVADYVALMDDINIQYGEAARSLGGGEPPVFAPDNTTPPIVLPTQFSSETLRVAVDVMWAVREAIRWGTSADDVIAAHNLTHPQDIADVHMAVARKGRSGGPRAPVEVMRAVRFAIERGASAKHVIAAYNLTHPQDIVEMREAVARVARRGQSAEGRPLWTTGSDGRMVRSIQR